VVRRIVACGGQQLAYPALTRYLLGLARRPRPRVLFMGTASGDGAGYLLTFYQAFAGVDCEPTHLALFDRVVDDIDALLRAQDVIIVGGGTPPTCSRSGGCTVSRPRCVTRMRMARC